jgi:transketolase
MRFPDARSFPGLIMWAGSTRGPVAPPGQYQVRLIAAGQTRSETFAIVRNPIGTATDADLQEQFRLAKQINDRVTAADEAVLRLRNIKEQIANRLAKLKDAKIAAAGDTLTSKLTDVEGEIYQYRNRSSQDPLNFPIRLNNKLAALQGLVESGDFKPTEQSYTVFKELSAQLEKQLGRVDALIETDVDAFNKQIVRKKLDPIKTEIPAPQ